MKINIFSSFIKSTNITKKSGSCNSGKSNSSTKGTNSKSSSNKSINSKTTTVKATYSTKVSTTKATTNKVNTSTKSNTTSSKSTSKPITYLNDAPKLYTSSGSFYSFGRPAESYATQNKYINSTKNETTSKLSKSCKSNLSMPQATKIPATVKRSKSNSDTMKLYQPTDSRSGKGAYTYEEYDSGKPVRK